MPDGFKVTKQTPFSALEAEHAQRLDSSKHLRAKAGRPETLYTHGRLLSGWGPKAKARRLEKYKNGANLVKQSLEREFGRALTEQLTDTLKKKNVDLDREVRISDLKTIRDEIGRLTLQRLPKLIPAGMEVDPDGKVSGRMSLHKDLFADTAGSITQSINDSGRGLMKKAARSNAAEAEKLGTSPHQMPLRSRIGSHFERDVQRMPIEIHDGDKPVINTQGKPVDASVNSLRQFAGSDEAAIVLGSVLNQVAVGRLLNGVTTRADAVGDGRERATRFNFPNRSQRLKPQRYTDPEGRTRTLAYGETGQYGGAKLKLSKTGSGDFRVDVDWPLYFNGAKDADGKRHMLALQHGELLRAHIKAAWTIDGEAAFNGQLVLTPPHDPSVEFSGSLKPDTFHTHDDADAWAFEAALKLDTQLQQRIDDLPDSADKNGLRSELRDLAGGLRALQMSGITSTGGPADSRQTFAELKVFAQRLDAF